MKRGLHVLYEYDVAGRPHASSYLRLLRPLSYPSVASEITFSRGRRYRQEDADAVVVDRLWRPDVSPSEVQALVAAVRRGGAKLIYNLDDNLLDLAPRVRRVGAQEVVWPDDRHRESLRLLLSEADVVWVTTPRLKHCLRPYCSSIEIIPNALDDRLLMRSPSQVSTTDGSPRPVVIGYMGTRTHDEDLQMIMPALRSISARYSDRVSFEVIGGVEKPETKAMLADLRVRYLDRDVIEHEYPYFLLWFSRAVRWDIAIAPLGSDPFADCKSDVKFLDYAAIGAAAICSRVPAYADTVRHGETGWLVENDVDAWVQALDTLITDADLCHHLADGALRYLYARRILAVAAPMWARAAISVIERA